MKAHRLSYIKPIWVRGVSWSSENEESSEASKSSKSTSSAWASDASSKAPITAASGASQETSSEFSERTLEYCRKFGALGASSFSQR